MADLAGAPALTFLTSAKLQQGIKPYFSSPLGQTNRAYQVRPHLGQFALTRIRKTPVKLGRDTKFKYRVAQKFKPFIMMLPGSIFVGPRAVRQCKIKKLWSCKGMPQHRFQQFSHVFGWHILYSVKILHARTVVISWPMAT